MSQCNILNGVSAQPKHRVATLLAAGWARVIAKVGRGAFVDALDVSENTVGNALAGRTTPELHTALNSLAADPTALDEVLAAYGFRLTPLHAAPANDLSTAAGTIDAMAALIRSQDDNHRDHNETLAIATLLRPHLASLQSIVREADELRGAA